MNAVELHNITKYYGKHRGIKDVSFSIVEGEIFGFIGPNGAGKSTTIRTLLNLIYPTAGSAAVFGRDIVKDSLEIRKHTGYLPSEVYYYDDMRARDLLKYAQAFHGKYNHRRAAELAGKLDLELNKKIEDLSFGNKKKLGIIQALLHQPKLLILDEPTGGLDPLIRNTFFEILREENRKGMTIFFSSHILSEVQTLCHRVAIIKDGELIKVETIENLIKNQFKKVSVLFDADDATNQVLSLEGIIKEERLGNTLHLLFEGNINVLIESLNQRKIKDLLIEEPSLDEVFIHYYEK